MESRAFLLAPTKRQTLPTSRNVAFAEQRRYAERGDASVKPECSIRRTEETPSDTVDFFKNMH